MFSIFVQHSSKGPIKLEVSLVISFQDICENWIQPKTYKHKSYIQFYLIRGSQIREGLVIFFKYEMYYSIYICNFVLNFFSGGSHCSHGLLKSTATAYNEIRTCIDRPNENSKLHDP